MLSSALFLFDVWRMLDASSIALYKLLFQKSHRLYEASSDSLPYSIVCCGGKISALFDRRNHFSIV